LRWHFASKHLHSGLKTIELTNFFATDIFNDGMKSILRMFRMMGIIVGHCAKEYTESRDAARIQLAEKRCKETSKEGRTARRQSASDEQHFLEHEEGVLYGAGIAE
jgi:hypothetical protein